MPTQRRSRLTIMSTGSWARRPRAGKVGKVFKDDFHVSILSSSVSRFFSVNAHLLGEKKERKRERGGQKRTYAVYVQNHTSESRKKPRDSFEAKSKSPATARCTPGHCPRDSSAPDLTSEVMILAATGPMILNKHSQ